MVRSHAAPCQFVVVRLSYGSDVLSGDEIDIHLHSSGINVRLSKPLRIEIASLPIALNL
jgi:hypothetical protein